ncbi:DDE-type integrase/transposase/recombinase [Vibrio fluvialis]|uniref:DDE-type integrase/transposase/recombinase n=1 Tax=Vibrio fluvialis TaxID=676 RepID=UPI00192C4186|nr:DDE-type integrase/transposase/recombinase [Vibrio fluvialis]MBL4244671.1 DDE-type integrase/transposase/recombinase [Vibrio fluvialis]MBL4253575.1 DDE-type integrase/transposase/recombinase [Vibrio fluvialis]
MEIVRNSVWQFKKADILEDGLYRVLEVLDAADCVILFPLSQTSATIRPVGISIEGFIQQSKRRKIQRSEYNTATHLLIDESEIPTPQRDRRDKNYRLIEGIVNNHEFLFDYATKKRTPYLAQYAKTVGSDRKSIARLLTQYWQNGQDKMALLPAFARSGGAGKERLAKDKALGAPKSPRTVALNRSSKYIVTDLDKDYFRKALKKYFLKENGMTLSKTYQHLLRERYENEIRLAEACGRAPYIPTLKQLSYWSKKLFDKDHIIQARTSESDYLRNKRSVLGSVTQVSSTIGSVFEIDATVADVHVVSELGTKYVLGRPTIYVVVDRSSRMIVGLHVSLYHASWRAARQALANCFLPKSEYCRQFGIEIEDSEWPVAHIPKSLVCDNGEMIGLKPQQVLTPMTQLKFTPPYRPDGKGIVEKRFDILNKELLHDLMGTTRGGNVVRGSRDPRKDAIYTLKEVTTQMIQAVLEHNRSIFDELAFSSPLLIQNDLAPTPLNYWKVHLAKHKHDLTLADSSEVIARLLPPTTVSMTRSGIHYNGMYYTCDEVEKLNLASVVRSSGRWQLDARVDENTTSLIYVRLDRNQGFTKCLLLPRSRMFENKTMIEADFMQDWLAAKKEQSPINVASIDDHKQRKQMAQSAKQRSKSTELSFGERTKNVRKNRRDELEATTNILTESDSQDIRGNSQTLIPASTQVHVLPRGRKRQASEDKE